MKLFKTLVFILAIGFSFQMHAQGSESKNTIDKKSYYEKRAAEDAKYEQQFASETKEDEETFWEEQKTYETNLKKKDRKAYMKGKKDAYAEHYEHCDNHCHHSTHYYSHASFYYYRYQNRRSTINTNLRVSTPRVRVGLGL